MHPDAELSHCDAPEESFYGERQIGEEVDGLPISCLPTDCLLHVFSFLPLVDVLRAARVCREWARVAAMPILWAHVDIGDADITDWAGMVHALDVRGTVSLNAFPHDSQAHRFDSCPALPPKLRALTAPGDRVEDILVRSDLGNLEVLVIGSFLEADDGFIHSGCDHSAALLPDFFASLNADRIRCLRLSWTILIPPFSFT